MQISTVIKKPQCLVQGHIFSLKNLKFSDLSHVYTLQDFYPHVDFSGVDLGIVITQTCDLAYRKSPYIMIGFLEPFEKNTTPIIKDQFVEKNFYKYSDAVFYNSEDYKKNLEKELGDLIQNRSQYYFFISIKSGKKISYYYLNLTKIFPLRCSNYNDILGKVKFVAKGDFQHLIGWKMANLYGRVGVEDYSVAGIAKIIESIAPKIARQLESSFNSKLVDVKNKQNLGDLKVKLKELSQADADKKQKIENKISSIIEKIATETIV
jgi:hypothetical protein